MHLSSFPLSPISLSRMAFFTAISRASSISRDTSLLLRCMSNVPKNTIYEGRADHRRHRLRLPLGGALGHGGDHVCLVNDSAAMVVHDYDTTLLITLDEMLVHCCAISRGAKRPFLVGDLPFGSYESSSTQGVDIAVRTLKEGGMDAIKLEGVSPSRITAVKAIVEAGIAVMGHVGLTLQANSVLGGFKPQGKNVSSAIKIVETALALQKVIYNHSFKGLQEVSVGMLFHSSLLFTFSKSNKHVDTMNYISEILKQCYDLINLF
ncbi:hypothetical protein UlMin_026319 [Ulmus minor]